MIRRRLPIVLATMLAAMVTMMVRGADPTATLYDFAQCDGSLTPYPTDVVSPLWPDTLQPVMINHVGRHGSRYPASAANCIKLRAALGKADSLGTITPLGRRLMAVTDAVIAASNGRWGALDSIGEAEQRQIATRMFANYGAVFGTGARVVAMSSYSPRSMMSMYCFLHQLDRLDNRITFETSTGRINSPLLRPFDTDKEYIDFMREGTWRPAYDAYFEAACPTAAIARALGRDYPWANADEWRDLAITEYYVIAGMPTMGMTVDQSEFFTREEYNALWSCFNLRQYLQRTATTVSAIPADIASPLLLDIIETTDACVRGEQSPAAILRFGHAETIMPLVSLMRLPGCYYLTNYFDTVALHWRDFEVVPMAANVQVVLFRATTSGRYYVRVELNERPVALIPGSDDTIIPWSRAREFLMRCVPIYYQ